MPAKYNKYQRWLYRLLGMAYAGSMFRLLRSSALPDTAPPSGTSLQAAFVSAMTNLTTAKTASYTAAQTERQALDTINAAGQSNLVAPGAITPELQQDLVRSSLDAHVQKAQAEQINSFADQELDRLEQTTRKAYLAKKLHVRVTDQAFQPVESYWLDKRTGGFRQGVYKTKQVTGRVEELSLRKNLLVLKPLWRSRLLVPERKFLAIYVVNPETLAPAVELTLL